MEAVSALNTEINALLLAVTSARFVSQGVMRAAPGTAGQGWSPGTAPGTALPCSPKALGRDKPGVVSRCRSCSWGTDRLWFAEGLPADPCWGISRSADGRGLLDPVTPDHTGAFPPTEQGSILTKECFLKEIIAFTVVKQMLLFISSNYFIIAYSP